MSSNYHTAAGADGDIAACTQTGQTNTTTSSVDIFTLIVYVLTILV